VKYITDSDVEDLALGAVILGTGGGGDPYIAKIMLREAIRRHGPVSLVSAADLDPDGLLLPVGMVGAPTAIVEKIPNGGEAAVVLEALERQLGRRGIAVMPVEVGGMNTLFPLAVAAALGLPCVDADPMRRAFPQIEMTLFTLAGISASPLTMCDAKGNLVVFQVSDNATSERLVRACVAQMGMIAVMSAYAVTAEMCAKHAVNGSLSYCIEIGRRVGKVQAGEPGAFERFISYCDATALFTGKVTDINRRTTGGFARGAVTLEHLDDPARVMRIEIQNENLIALEDDQPLAMVPDLITLIDTETAIPMTTEGLAYGQRLHVIAMPAHERWHSPEGLALAGPRAFGYDMDYVPIGGE
jgi:uncharacterized protein